MESAQFKFCPSCKLANPVDAILCEYCGRPFDSSVENYLRTMQIKRETKALSKDLEAKEASQTRLVPSEGIAIFIIGQPKPVDIRLEKEFFVGRLTETTEEKVVDLTAYDAFALGVSRRHLMVRRVGNGYEVVDLSSRNGTWVNGETLVPQAPFPIQSGSQIRLGNLRLVVSFRQQNSQEETAQGRG